MEGGQPLDNGKAQGKRPPLGCLRRNEILGIPWF